MKSHRKFVVSEATNICEAAADGWSVDEIAELYEVSPAKIHSLLHNCKKYLKKSA